MAESTEEPLTQTSAELASRPIGEEKIATIHLEGVELPTQLLSLSRVVGSRQEME